MQQENLGCFPDPQGPDSWGCGVQGPLGPTEMVAGMAFAEATALERILCLVHHLLLGHELRGTRTHSGPPGVGCVVGYRPSQRSQTEDLLAGLFLLVGLVHSILTQ